jgi:5'-nucleotidase
LNDTYRLDAVNNETAGGFARVTTLVRQLKQENNDVPIVISHAGDFIFPSLESQIWNGRQMVEALNFLAALAPVYLVPGNHEFEKKTQDAFMGAVKASSPSQFHWIASNLTPQMTDVAANARIKPYETFQAGALKVGMFALTLGEADGGENRVYAPIDGDYQGTARVAIEALQAAGAQVIIGVTHLTLALDQRVSALRAEYPEFIWIAGGHEHTPQEQALSPGKSRITKGASNARAVWQVTIGLDSQGQLALQDRLIEVGENIPEDQDYLDKIQNPYYKQLEEKVSYVYKRIGTTTVPIDAKEETVRNAESNWGNFLTDLMRVAFGSDNQADIAVLNSGTLRIDDTFSGDITFEHLLRTFFFPTPILFVSMTGQDFVEQVLEHGLSASNTDGTLKPGDGRFLQVAGIRMCFDPSKAQDQRVVKTQIRAGDSWQDIDDAQLYRVAITDYMYAGGDGYTLKQFSVDPTLPGADLKYLALDAISAKDWKGEAISPQLEGRIVDTSKEKCFS